MADDAAQWSPDILGDGFQARSLPLEPDAGEELSATLVRSTPSRRWFLSRRRPFEGVDVLYIHGWSDYFFQRGLASFWTERGARFQALDLRRYGRSLRPGQVLGHVTSLNQYDEEIDAALAIMADGTRRRTVILAHSTGGLTASLWAARHPGRIDALVLNSPWLEFQLDHTARALIAPIDAIHSHLRPGDLSPQLDDGSYTRAQAIVDPDGQVQHPDGWRPARAARMNATTLNAILAGHATVAAGALGIEVPICVLLSARSILPTRWSDDLTGVDSVLDVRNVARASLGLGRSVTIERIDGALHDVFLSAPDARADAYARLEWWMRGVLLE